MRWLALAAALVAGAAIAEGERPVERHWVTAPDAPRSQTSDEAAAKTTGCMSCHTATDAWTMHKTGAVVLGCSDCHGGDPKLVADKGWTRTDPRYLAMKAKAHVLPRYPGSWPTSANPKASYTLLNREAPQFVRFVNPSDYRVVRESCGACHMDTIVAAERSLMATGAMFFGGASYNNGVLPWKNYRFGEAYTKAGEPARLVTPGSGILSAAELARGALPTLYPLPQWQVTPPADIFRVFERGGRNISSQFPEIGLPNAGGQLQRIEEPGRPDIRQSNRGPGTGLRIAIPVLNIHKTRLNDPFTWFMGTNDQPGDYRTSGCAACHVVYANDREPRHSSIWAQYGRDGLSFSADPTIPKDEPGHPVQHSFTSAIPTAQCMNCHMHQPNMFVNSFLGYTMWDYESDAKAMWPAKQAYPTAAQVRAVNDRNPEGAAARGLWGDPEFLRTVADRNDTLKDGQFADYHGHGWNFRAVYKRDRDGNLLDAAGKIVAADDPEKFRKPGNPQFGPVAGQAGKAVHMMSIHAEKGMQCGDCHFAQDGHGNGYIHGEVANAVEIGCKDCHGSASAYPNLRTSNLAAPPTGTDLTLLRNPDGRRRFEWRDDGGRRQLWQRSASDPKLEWRVHLVKDTVERGNPDFNAKAARAKLMGRVGADGSMKWGPGAGSLAHSDDKMACYSCHVSWTPSCSGCHLPIEANWKTTSHKYNAEETRNYATYNPQVARDDMFMLGLHQTTKGNIVAPIRSSSALVLSSTNINRERIYVQQPPISAAGFSSQAFGAHYPHTERTTETKTCSDCHLSAANDNNAIMAQLLLNGTNFTNFVGMHAFVGLGGGLEAVRITEWGEPQAVFGSYLQRYAYPDYYALHLKHGRELIDWVRGKVLDKKRSGETDPTEDIRNVRQATGGPAKCLQLRGEYLYVAEGKGGFTAYDVANIGNKGVSEKIVRSPFSPLGHNTHVDLPDATCMALPTNQSISVQRNKAMLAGEAAHPDSASNQEQAFHPLYRYAVVTDAVQGLVLVDIDTLTDREPRNNFLRAAPAWNPGGVLTGARHVTLGGHFAYVATPRAMVVVDLDNPLHPRLAATVPMDDPRASAVQFRYLFVTTARGLETLDITRLDRPVATGAIVPLADARRVYVARTYAYVAAGKQGLVIVDAKNPEAMRPYGAYDFGGRLSDAQDVVVGSTNASLFAYVADGANGLKVLQLTSPDSQPNFYGFSPAPRPELIAWAKTPTPALALSKGLDRDRAVDESGHQIAVFGRLGSRPFTRAEMERLFLGASGVPYKVVDTVDDAGWSPLRR